MTDWTERLSDYLDDELSGDERARIDEALKGDVELRRLLEDLQAVKDTAGSLPQHPPEVDLWPAIESRIGAGEEEAVVVELADVRRVRRRLSFTIPQLAAAAVSMLVLGSASVWLAMSAGVGGPEGATPIAVAPEVGFVSAPEEASTFSYEATIQDLEAQLRVGRDRLDPKTVQALEGSLATIDRAIARAREALEADPASVYLNRHLADARSRKLRVLEQAAVLASS